jgi:hypothetical protein
VFIFDIESVHFILKGFDPMEKIEKTDYIVLSENNQSTILKSIFLEIGIPAHSWKTMINSETRMFTIEIFPESLIVLNFCNTTNTS